MWYSSSNQSHLTAKKLCFNKVHEQTEVYVIWLSRLRKWGNKNQRLIFVHVWLSKYLHRKANVKHKTALLLIHFTCITITFKTRYNLLCGVRQEKTRNFIVSEGTGQQKWREGQLNCKPLNPRLLLSVKKWPTGNGWSLLWK